ncbi:MAG: hypothetical protein ACLP2Y_11580 [Limisphaerales bacterium]
MNANCIDTEVLASGYAPDGKGLDIHFSPDGRFFKQIAERQLIKITPRQAVREFIKLVNAGECFSGDLTPLILAV